MALVEKLKPSRSSVAEECGRALDHLRNALDLLPPRSAPAYAMLELIRGLAKFVDQAVPRGPTR
jgi:hypothetical protein